MKLDKKTLLSLITEVMKEEEEKSTFPALKQFRKMSRGVMENDGELKPEEEAEPLIAEPPIIEEDDNKISMKDFNKLVDRVVGIYSLMDPELRRSHMREKFNRFGLGNMKDFLRLQNSLADSQKGKLDDQKKKAG